MDRRTNTHSETTYCNPDRQRDTQTHTQSETTYCNPDRQTDTQTHTQKQPTAIDCFPCPQSSEISVYQLVKISVNIFKDRFQFPTLPDRVHFFYPIQKYSTLFLSANSKALPFEGQNVRHRHIHVFRDIWFGACKTSSFSSLPILSVNTNGVETGSVDPLQTHFKLDRSMTSRDRLSLFCLKRRRCC